jgi:hypothetical protein
MRQERRQYARGPATVNILYTAYRTKPNVEDFQVPIAVRYKAQKGAVDGGR